MDNGQIVADFAKTGLFIPCSRYCIIQYLVTLYKVTDHHKGPICYTWAGVTGVPLLFPFQQTIYECSHSQIRNSHISSRHHVHPISICHVGYCTSIVSPTMINMISSQEAIRITRNTLQGNYLHDQWCCLFCIQIFRHYSLEFRGKILKNMLFFSF